MSTVLFRRPPRRGGPAMPRGEVLLESPPELPEQLPRGMGQLLMVLPMLAGAGAMAFLFGQGNGQGGTVRYIAGGLFAVSMLGMMVGSVANGGGQAKAELDAERRDYMRYLAQVRRQVRRARAQQRASLVWRHPAPDALWSVVAGRRLWERRVTDEDFGELRFAVGPQRLAVQLVPPETKPVEDLEPLTSVALRRFVRTYSTVDDLPVALSLRSFGRVVVQGDRESTVGLVRAVLAQATALHSPDDLVVAVCAPHERWPAWDWTKWLPHALDAGATDAAGPGRRVAETLPEVEEAHAELLATLPRHSPNATPVTGQAHLLVVLDGGEVGPDCQLVGGGLAGTTVIDLSGVVPRDAGRSTIVLRVDTVDGELRIGTVQGAAVHPIGVADALAAPQVEALARQLAPYRLTVGGVGEEPLARALELTDLLGVGDPERIDPTATWRLRPTRDRLRIPIGVDPEGASVELDLKESAQEGMGPHGLIIGATGSGKSELLRTLVAGLAITHSSEQLNFVLVDFKGGATFAGLADLPHTSAVITNLADELPLVDRMQDALHGEMVRRQELLRAAGNIASLRDYEKGRQAGAPLEPIPSLLVVCDEFSELLSAKPEFIDLFVMIGRLGRSLGVHLLLASQRLEEGKLRGLDTHLSYRIGLRTFSAVESRIVLGVPDAYELPSAPGHGYLKIDTATMLRFRAAYVSGPHRRSDASQPSRRLAAAARQVVPYSLAPAPSAVPLTQPEPVVEDDPAGETLLDVVVGQLKGQGPKAHQVWLPPLSTPPTLDALLPPLVADPDRGLTAPGRTSLIVPVGVLDRPFEQRRDVLRADLEGAAGHVVVAGGPQSGKSTLLRTLVCSMALTHTPAETQFYCLDFGGGALSTLRGLPHVGGVAARTDVETVRRLVAEVTTVLDEREKRFAELGVDSMPTYRRRRAAGELTDDPFGDVFLVVDGWGTLRAEYEDLEQAITSLAARGLGYGVHVVVSVVRWAELRPALRDLLGTRFELRLGDPSESDVDRRAAVNVPAGSPGRGLSRDKLHFLTALPRLDGHASAEDLSVGVADLVRRVATAWEGPVAPPVRLLPTLYTADRLPPADDPRGVPVGISESDLAPVFLDFAADPHFIVFGDASAGKTSFLRVLAQQLVARHSPAEARFILADYRRTLLGTVGEDHLIGYAASGTALAPMIADVRSAMEKRLPGPGVTADQLRTRSWWTGPELYVLVDDYDLVVTPSGNPLAGLMEFLPQAQDVGLHVVVARRSGGASRAMFEPVMQRLKDVGTPGLVMSGSRDEGVLLGTTRPSQQPAGRGTLVGRRAGAELMQVAYSPQG
ncbi:MAG TPA: type VII secretion protein EccCa [Mycobacteriales bacterium]|nr:type VII secretion protein EccCa [Mycobacteriales bacterium]